uniref:Uncharacterized protein n=1 Tax=Arundo donax TaxID=35708 RepID=A0A0A8Y3U6_ARUDO
MAKNLLGFKNNAAPYSFCSIWFSHLLSKEPSTSLSKPGLCAKASFILFFAVSMAALISATAGLSSPSTNLNAMRRGCEALKQFSISVQKSIESIIFSTLLPSACIDNLFSCQSSLTKRLLRPCLCLYILAKVRNDVAKRVTAGLTRSPPILALIASRILPCL